MAKKKCVQCIHTLFVHVKKIKAADLNGCVNKDKSSLFDRCIVRFGLNCKCASKIIERRLLESQFNSLFVYIFFIILG